MDAITGAAELAPINCFEDLLGHTCTSVVNINDDEIQFHLTDGRAFKLYHYQDCCEVVYVDDICGDLNDLVGSPLTMAEKPSSQDGFEIPKPGYEGDSVTWTFYKLATIKGYVDIRWNGSSNGYYSESVDFGVVS